MFITYFVLLLDQLPPGVEIRFAILGVFPGLVPEKNQLEQVAVIERVFVGAANFPGLLGTIDRFVLVAGQSPRTVFQVFEIFGAVRAFPRVFLVKRIEPQRPSFRQCKLRRGR